MSLVVRVMVNNSFRYVHFKAAVYSLLVFFSLFLTLGIMAANMTVRAYWKGQVIRNSAVKYVLCIKGGIYNYD